MTKDVDHAALRGAVRQVGPANGETITNDLHRPRLTHGVHLLVALDKAPRPPETSKEERRRGLIGGLTFGIGMFVVGGGVGLVTAFVSGNIALAFMLAIVGWVIALVVGMVVVLTIFRDDLFGKKPPHSE